MIETTILSNLVYKDGYARDVLPYIKYEYFQKPSEQILFKLIENHYTKYGQGPTQETLRIDLSSKSINEGIYDEAVTTLGSFVSSELSNDWLLEKTEEFCKNRAIHNALFKSVTMFQDNKLTMDDMGVIPEMMQEALAISFDHAIGHDYLEDSDARFQFYHRSQDKIPFDLDFFNTITDGGLPTKTMLVLLGGTGGGKSLTKCHIAASYLMQGKNVLYLTMEMSEEAISQRIDQNLLNVTQEDLKDMPESVFKARVDQIKGQTAGKLIVKQYPNAGGHAGHFRRLLQELELKKKFKVDLICVDYINICASSRFKSGASNSYEYIKAIAEELRGLAVEFDTRLITSTQVNRDGFGSSEIDLTNTSDSFGIPYTADYMLALWATEEMDNAGQLAMKQLKNRYGDVNKPSSIILGADKSKMRLFNLDARGQMNAMANHPDDEQSVFDSSQFHQSDIARNVQELFTR